MTAKGDCYSVHANTVVEYQDDNLVLCHGIAVGTEGGETEGKRFGHAWLELRGVMVVDISNGRPYRAIAKSVYYAAGQIQEDEVVRYEWAEAAAKMLGTGHFGPWDPRFDNDVL